LKKLIEKRNDLVAEMTNIVNKAKAENRAVTEDEKKRFDACKVEIANIDATVKMNEEMGAFENVVLADPKPAMTDKEKDEKAFINLIKQINPLRGCQKLNLQKSYLFVQHFSLQIK
jgi:hypothetical protein